MFPSLICMQKVAYIFICVYTCRRNPPCGKNPDGGARSVLRIARIPALLAFVPTMRFFVSSMIYVLANAPRHQLYEQKYRPLTRRVCRPSRNL